MSEEEIVEKKLKKLTGAKDLSAAIEKLERKKAAMEDDFKEEAHNFFENLNPINVLNNTLQNVKKLSSSNYALFKDAVAFGAGYFSKRQLIHQLKQALIRSFNGSATSGKLILKVTDDGRNSSEMNSRSNYNKKEKGYMDSQTEKVKAKPEVLPEPTYWPFFLAMGLAFLGWGLLTTWLISLAGFIILIVALTGWINILRHE